ncbi:MAG: hypothetical protein M1838_000891 [Thelocarpon superellum]|nr:MAG: hypothetical protein M1838_000891 [Thelocarpon superellum]
MPLIRKRRASHPVNPEPVESASSDSEANGADQLNAECGDGADTQVDGTGRQQMVKKMVRLALASEYARQPIRRVDVASKVLGQNSRQFKPVFQDAQTQLRSVFGMEMVELPIREKVTISQRRAAQRVDKASTTSKAYILQSILPDKYRSDPRILPPPKIPTSENEATYNGLYTFLISVIYLSGGTIGEAKLERHLKRVNADQYTPIDKTEKLLLRLCKEGYLTRVKDSSGGEEVVEYMVGPRGKLEVGIDGVMGVAKTVYGDMEDLEAKVQRSMGLDEEQSKKKKKKKKGPESSQQAGGPSGTATRGPGRPGRPGRSVSRAATGASRGTAEDGEEESEDDDDEEEEDDDDDDDDDDDE